MNNRDNIIYSQTDISEKYQLLKLRMDGGAIAWFLYSEKHKLNTETKDGVKSIINERIELELRSLGSSNTMFRANDRVMELCAETNSFLGTLRFANGFIIVEDPWKGLRIGTYMMNQVVAWALNNYPTYQPTGINLLIYQADEENKERRNRFYRQFGFQFNWNDSERKTGSLDPTLKVSDLNTVEKWKERIEVMSLTEGLASVFRESDNNRMNAKCADQSIQYANEARGRAEDRVKLAYARNKIWGALGVVLGIFIANHFGF